MHQTEAKCSIAAWQGKPQDSNAVKICNVSHTHFQGASNHPSLLVWRIVRLGAKPELLPKVLEMLSKNGSIKKQVLSYFHGILSFHACLVLFCLANDIPVNNTTYFVLTLDWTLSPRHAVLSLMTHNPQRTNVDMIKTCKNIKFSVWAADLLVTLVFRLGQNALHAFPHLMGPTNCKKYHKGIII